MPIVPKPGDFGLCRGQGAAMALVRLGTFSRYGHAVACEEVSPDGVITIIEAMPDGVRRRQARAGEFVWSDYPLTDEQRDTIVAWHRATVGRPYDWPAIGGFIGRWLKARLPHRDRRALTREAALPPGEGHLMCSEAQVRSWRLAGVDTGQGKPADAVSPGDLRQWLDDRHRALNRRAGK